jgi:nucleoside-diphosphate-sugar epimerase
MRILITGATGFIGSNLCKKLLTQGHEIAILARKESSFERIIDDLKMINVINVDYSNLQNNDLEIINFKPEIAYHIGWVGVENSSHNDDKMLLENIQTTLSLTKILIKCNVKVVVALGSQAEYGQYNQVINENFPTKPTSFYGTAKVCAHNILNHYFVLHNIRFVWLRLFSSYGPYDNPNWLIPYMIKTINDGKTPSFTKAEQIWDFIYVDDVIDAIVECGENDNTKGIYNLGSGIGYPLKDVITKIRDKINPKISLNFGELPYKFNQTMVLHADITKLRIDSNWSPKIQIEEGIDLTINSFLKFKK